MRDVYAIMRYPRAAYDAGIEGKAVVQFRVEADGVIDDIRVVRSTGNNDLDNEAVNICKLLKPFIPGREDGKNVSAWLTLPVSFKLNDVQSGKVAVEQAEEALPIEEIEDNVVRPYPATDVAEKQDVGDEIYKHTDVFPQYPGRIFQLIADINASITYTDNASGAVVIRFVVEKDGSVGIAEVLRSSGNKTLDDEALRAVTSLKRFTPGTIDGKPVRVWYTMPITFNTNY